MEPTVAGSSGHSCGACGNNIKLGEEIFFLHVHRLVSNEQGVFLSDELDDGGDYVYVPYFLCVNCWDEDCTALMDTVHGVHPDKTFPYLRQCDVCHSSILSGELIGLLESGALFLSEQQPLGFRCAVNFHSAGDPYYICTVCMNALNTEVREYWEEDVRNDGECPEGLEERCWRTGECQHVCKHERAWQWASENTTSVPTPSDG